MSPSAPKPAAAPTIAAAQAPLAANRTLVVSNAFAFTTKDTDPARSGPFFHAVYDTLLTFAVGDTTTPKPLVAESSTSSPDARTFTFTLRKHVKFSDGTPLKPSAPADAPFILAAGMPSTDAGRRCRR